MRIFRCFLVFTLALFLILSGSLGSIHAASTARASASNYSVEINVPMNRLYLYKNNTLDRVYPVCTGKPSTQTPLGSFKISSKIVNPTWTYKGKVVPPGPKNPLGVRWMSIYKDIGIHGNSSPGSIGSFASLGCIRMFNRDVTELFNIVPINTPVHVKYDRLVVQYDEYLNRNTVILYPDIYNKDKNFAKYRALIEKAGFSKQDIQQLEKLFAQKLSRPTAAFSTGIFINGAFLTSDAFVEKEIVYVNYAALQKRLGISAQGIQENKIATMERDERIYVSLNGAVKVIKGYQHYDSKHQSAHVTAEIITANGVHLSSIKNGFDKDYTLEAAAFAKLGLEERMLKALNASLTVNSADRTIDISIKPEIRHGSHRIPVYMDGNRVLIENAHAVLLSDLDMALLQYDTVRIDKREYIDITEFLLEKRFYANTYRTVISSGEN